MQNFGTYLGVGVGFRQELRSELIFDPEQIDFVEVIGDAYMTDDPAKLDELNDLIGQYTVIPHFIGTCLGSATGVDSKYVDDLAKVVSLIKPPYWSEHLCFTNAHGVEIGHLTPVPYSTEALDAFAKNIEQVKKSVATPLILENITYVISDVLQEYSEAEFINAILEQNDVGLLLDITNVYANSMNHKFDYKAFLDALSLDRVVQLHFVGIQERDGWIIDNHASATQEPIWKIMEEVATRCKHLKGAILERDNAVPTLDILRPEVQRAREILFQS
jgi:uncharacterized protein (UPF0276 family)